MRVTVINHKNDVLYDTFVKPKNEVVDYNTMWSGITEEDLQNVTTTLEDVHNHLLKIIPASSILVGQSLESDLKALRMIHENIIDTSILYPHPRGPPYKRSLRDLSSQYLKRFIQSDPQGHDSYEDAVASMDLAKMKFIKGPQYGTI